MRRLVPFIAFALAAGCARPPGALRGSFPPLTPRDAQPREPAGERVRWGGEIVGTTPGRSETCVEVVSKPLDRAARPTTADETWGRFIACAPGFYDPAVFAPKRELTVVGTLGEPIDGKVGEYEYRFPRVAAEVLYLWPRRPERVDVYPYYDPFWGPGWGPWWGWGGWGGWGGRYYDGPRRHPHRPRPPARPPRR